MSAQNSQADLVRRRAEHAGALAALQTARAKLELAHFESNAAEAEQRVKDAIKAASKSG